MKKPNKNIKTLLTVTAAGLVSHALYGGLAPDEMGISLVEYVGATYVSPEIGQYAMKAAFHKAETLVALAFSAYSLQLK